MKLVSALGTLSVVLALASGASLFVTVAPSGEEAFRTLCIVLFASTALALLATCIAFVTTKRARRDSRWSTFARLGAIGLTCIVLAALCMSTV